MAGIFFQTGENYNIRKEKIVKVTEYSGTESIEIQDVTNNSRNISDYIKLSKHEFCDKKTGEIYKYKINNIKSSQSVKKSMNKLDKLMRNNFSGASNEIFVTLTTADNIADVDTINSYFKKFWRKLKNRYSEYGLEYIYIIEMQQLRQSWHIHSIIKSTTKKKLFIDNQIIQQLWNKGNTKTSRIREHSSVEIDEELAIDGKVPKLFMVTEQLGIDKIIEYMTKLRTKDNLPSGKRVYYKSKGIENPKIQKIQYKDIKDIIDAKYQLQSERTTLIKSTKTGAIVNKIKTETWKKR